jgi:glycosyltransferase involved in cell wall biosynthesis
MNRISVVIPAYNSSGFIGATLKSVLGQTLPPEEVLVIDDGSTDDTAAVAESFGTRVRVFRGPNSGPGASRNLGVLQATSEWVAFIDADDLWEPTKLERQMQELSRHPGIDLSYTAHVRFSQEGETIRFCGDAPPLFAPAENIRKALFQSATFLTSSAIIRRSTFLAIGGFNDQRIGEDWDLWLRLLHGGAKFVSCPEPLLLYRIHDSNVTTNKRVLIEESTAVFRRHVLPHLSGPEKWIAASRFTSMYDTERAYALREAGDRGYLARMTSSIIRWPFGDGNRYKMWVHMLLSRLGIISKGR